MKKTILSLIIIQLAVFPSVAFATCTHAVGDVVKILPPATVAEQMSSYAVVKDEFESTEEFNARKKVALQKISNGTIIVETTYNPEYAHYDADMEIFLIEPYAWSNINGRFDRSIPSVSSRDSATGNLHAVGLQNEEKIIDTYKGSNNYGKEVEVVKILRNVYGLFDEKYKRGKDTWVTDVKESFDYLDGSRTAEGVFLPTPKKKAKTLKTRMRFGIEFTPKEPFLFRGKDHSKPTTDRPTEIIIEVSTIAADLECLVITDAKGTVLKVVEVGY